MATEKLGTCSKLNELGIPFHQSLTPLEQAALEFIIEYNTDRDHDNECVSDLHVGLELSGINVDDLLRQIGTKHPEKYPHLAPPKIRETVANIKRHRTKISKKLMGKVGV